MNKIKRQKGFTLIELLVVIAIIGILAAIVLVNVNSARKKAQDAGIQGNMASLPAAAELFYDTNNTYTGVDGAGTDFSRTKTAVEVIAGSGTFVTAVGTTASAGTTWCACSPLKNTTTSETWCVDSAGKKGKSTTACAATRCSAATGACSN